MKQIEAGDIGVSDSTATRRLQKPQMKALVERLHTELIDSSLAQSRDNIRHAINVYRTTPKDDPQLREHGWKASNKMLESVGIFPSHTPSVLIQNIFNEGDTVTVSAELSQLGEFLRDRWSGACPDVPDVVDITPGNSGDRVGTGEKAEEEG